MRERAFTTAIVWIAGMFGIDRLIASLRYTELVPNPEYVAPDLTGIANPEQLMPFFYNNNAMIQQTVWAPTMWQIAVVVLIALIVIAAAAATLAMWVGNQQHQASSEKQAKAKRHDREREARVRRLLDTMDDEELAALEAGEVGDDGERVTMETLLRRQ